MTQLDESVKLHQLLSAKTSSDLVTRPDILLNPNEPKENWELNPELLPNPEAVTTLDNCALCHLTAHASVGTNVFNTIKWNIEDEDNDLIEFTDSQGNPFAPSHLFRLKRTGLQLITFYARNSDGNVANWAYYALFNSNNDREHGIGNVTGLIWGQSGHPTKVLLNVTDTSTLYYIKMVSGGGSHTLHSSNSFLLVEHQEPAYKVDTAAILKNQIAAINAIKAQQATTELALQNKLNNSIAQLDDEKTAVETDITASITTATTQINTLKTEAITTIEQSKFDNENYDLHPTPNWFIDYTNNLEYGWISTKGSLTPDRTYAAKIATDQSFAIFTDGIENLSFGQSFDVDIWIKKSDADFLKIEIWNATNTPKYLSTKYINANTGAVENDTLGNSGFTTSDDLTIKSTALIENTWWHVKGELVIRKEAPSNSDYRMQLSFYENTTSHNPATVDHEIWKVELNKNLNYQSPGLIIDRFEPETRHAIQNNVSFNVGLDFTKCDFFTATFCENTGHTTTILHKFSHDVNRMYRMWFHSTWHANFYIDNTKTGQVKLTISGSVTHLISIDLWVVNQDKLLEFITTFFNNNKNNAIASLNATRDSISAFLATETDDHSDAIDLKHVQALEAIEAKRAELIALGESSATVINESITGVQDTIAGYQNTSITAITEHKENAIAEIKTQGNKQFIVETDHTLTAYSEMNCIPFLLADDRVVPTRRLTTDDITHYSFTRQHQVYNPQYAFDGNDSTRVNGHFLSHNKGCRVHFTEPFVTRKLRSIFSSSRSGRVRVDNFFGYVSVSNWNKVTRTDLNNSITRAPRNELIFYCDYDATVYTLDLDIEDKNSQIIIDGKTVQNGETIFVPKALESENVPSAIYQYTQALGERWALDPIDHTLVEYNNGQLKLSQAPSTKTILTANAETQAAINSIQTEWFYYSENVPNLDIVGWKVWIQKTEDTVKMFIRTDDEQFFDITNLNAIG